MRSIEAYCPHRRTTWRHKRESAAFGRTRQLRREPPVLTVRVHRVGRRTDTHARREQVAVGPGFEPERVAADRQVEGERRGPRVVQLGEGDVGEVLGELVAGLDSVGGTIGVRRVDGDLGTEPGILGDVWRRCHPTLDVGPQLTRDSADGVEQLRPSPPAEVSPVEERTDVGHRCGGKCLVVEVHLVPVQPADGSVRAGVERLVEERGIEGQRDQGVDAELRQPARPRAARWLNDGSGASRSHKA